MRRALWVVLSLALAARALAGARGADPWRSAPVRRAVDAWAQAEAHRLAGEPSAGRAAYVRAVTLCRHALAARRETAWEPILLAVLESSRQGRATMAQVVAKAAPPLDLLARLARRKVRGDREAREGDGLHAHLSYASFLRGCDLFRERHPADDGVKALRWLRGRVERRLARLPADTDAVAATSRASIERAIRRALAADSEAPPPADGDVLGLKLRVLRAAVRPISRDCAHSRLLDHPPRVPEAFAIAVRPLVGGPPRDKVGRALASLSPYRVPDPQKDAPGELALRGLGAAIVGLLAEWSQQRVAFAQGELEALLYWAVASGLGGEALAEVARALARVRPKVKGETVVMGGGDAERRDYRSLALELYLETLQRYPHGETCDRVVTQAVRLAAELKATAETSAKIDKRLGSYAPGLLGVLQFRLLLAQRRSDDAYALLTKLIAEPGRYLPSSPASAAVLAEGFTHFLSRGRPSVAEQALEAAARLGLASDAAADRWLALAGGYRKARRPDDARRVAETLAAKTTDDAVRTKATALLVRLRVDEDGERPVLTPGELALLAEEARIDPRRTEALAAEYRRAGMYREARAAYAVAARRFRSLAARRALIETFLEEGKLAAGEGATVAFLADHHGTPDARTLYAFVTRRCIDRGDSLAWARLCHRLAGDRRAPVASFYADKLAAWITKTRRGGGTALPATAAATLARLRASAAWPRIEARLRGQRHAIARALPARLVVPES